MKTKLDEEKLTKPSSHNPTKSTQGQGQGGVTTSIEELYIQQHRLSSQDPSQLDSPQPNISSLKLKEFINKQHYIYKHQLLEPTSNTVVQNSLNISNKIYH